MSMLEVLILILIIMWLGGFSMSVGGSLIHIILIVVVVLVLVRLLRNRGDRL